MIKDWICEENLNPFLEIIAGHAGYGFGPDDWTAIRFGIQDTDEERGRWYEYEFPASQPMRLRLARDPGSSVLFVCTESDAETERTIQEVFRIAQRYRLSKRGTAS